MKLLLKNTATLTLIIVLTGSAACTSMQTARGTQRAIEAHDIGAGNKVTLNYTDGSSQTIRVTNVGADEIEGRARDGHRVVADYRDIIDVDYRKFEALKTAGAIVGGAALAAVLTAGMSADLLGGG